LPASLYAARCFSDILRVGAIAAFSPLQSVLTVLILTRAIASFGTEALAGYGIGARLEFLLVPIAFAVGVACVPMVGMAVGAGRIGRARRWPGPALPLRVALGLIGVLVATLPHLWSGLFSADARLRGPPTSISGSPDRPFRCSASDCAFISPRRGRVGC
jgi:Na+-driven multidrug efflux pump